MGRWADGKMERWKDGIMNFSFADFYMFSCSRVLIISYGICDFRSLEDMRSVEGGDE
jgi:hypothetical protein